MQPEQQAESLQALQDIRGIMERSARFLSLSGWSGVWAGSTALVAAFVARLMIRGYKEQTGAGPDYIPELHYTDTIILQFLLLGIATFAVALAGGFYFTWRKVKRQGVSFWNHSSRQLVVQIMIPMLAGGVFCLAFLYDGAINFIVPSCLTFYGLALVNGSKYTLHDIRYLGILEVVLGCTSFLFPRLGLLLWDPLESTCRHASLSIL